MPELADDPRFGRNEDRTANRDELRPLLVERLRTRSKQEWFREIIAAGVPCGPINTIDQGIAFAEEVGLDPVVTVGEGAVAVPSVRNPIRFSATDEALRPMGRATSGVFGMRFNDGDELLSIAVVQPGLFVLVATAVGYAKRTPIDDYPVQGRGGKGVLTIQDDRRRGKLVGALVVDIDDELYAITSSGGVIRTTAKEVRKAGRQTKGVRLMNLGEGASLVAVARNAEEAGDPDAGVAPTRGES